MKAAGSEAKPAAVRTGWAGSAQFWNRLPRFQRVASAFLLLGAAGFMAVLLLAAPEQLQTARGASPIALAFMAAISLWLLAVGRLRAATYVMIYGTWLDVSAVSIFTGGLHANLIILYPLLIIMAGWRLGPRAAYLLAALTSLVCLGFYLAAHTGMLPVALPNPPALPLVLQMLVFTFSAFMVNSLVRTYNDRLAEVSELSEDLAKRTAELQAREADLNRAQSVGRIGSWTYDVAADLMRSSSEACRIFGVSEGSCFKHNDFLERVHPGDRVAVSGAWEAACARGKSFRIEHRLVVGHEVRWVAQLAEFERDTEGRPGRAVGSIQDMTEQKRLEQRLSLTLDIAQVVPWELNLRTGRLIFDWALLPGLGLQPDESLESLQGWIARVHPDDVPHFMEQLQSALQPGNSMFDCEYRISTADGQYQWVHAKGSVVQRGQDGQAEFAVGTAMNISARKQIDEAVRLGEERSRNLATLLRLMADNVPDMIWAKDMEKRYLFANKAICEQLLHATDTNEPIGKTVMFFAQRERAAHPDNPQWQTFGELCEDTDASTLQQGEASAFEESGYINGKLVYLDVRKAPFVNERGEVIGTVGSARDVTERKRAEAELAAHRHHLEDLVQQRSAELTATEARASRILESSADGLYGVDPDGIITFINPAACRMLGYSPEEAIGRGAHALFHHSKPDGSPYPDEECPSRNAARTGQEVRVDDETYWHADGHAVPVMYAVHPITQDGRNMGAVVSFVDISVQRAAAQAREQALIAAENLARARSEFLANMSHEIRTPMNGVLGFAHIGYRSYQDSDKARDAFEKILASGKQLLGVVDGILDFSRIEAGKLPIDVLDMSLVETMNQALGVVADRGRAKGLDLRLEMAADFPQTCVGDPLRIGQILLNLLSNAVKFTASGSVVLSASRQGDDLVFRVTDSGIGMNAEEVGRVFDPFQQADGSTTRKFGGTGLGLAISKRLVELMNGDIRVESRPGVGTMVEFRLPYVAADGSSVLRDSVDTSRGEKRLEGISVLVAEDDAVNQTVLEVILADQGAKVVMTSDGREAVERVRADGNACYDLVLMDIQMPEMDGYEATRRILELAPDLPIVGQTANAFSEDRDACLAAGMVAHIAKPIDPQALAELVLQVVSGRRRK